MNDENTLRSKAREAMEAGKIPHLPPPRMWGGPGTGAECVICLKPVRRDEIGFELEFAADGSGWNEAIHYIHLPCFSAWDRERVTFESNGRDRRDSAAPQQIHAGIQNGATAITASGALAGGTLLPSCKNDGRISGQNEETLLARERNSRYRRGPE